MWVKEYSSNSFSNATRLPISLLLLFKIKSQIESGQIVESTDPGAPENPRIVQKFLISLLKLIDQAEDIILNEKESLRNSILEKIDYVSKLDIKLPEERIAQEVAILLIKGDVREELDRLRMHINSLEELLANGGVIGRKLDFACQELGREANTICSKTNNIELSRIGIELKTLVDEIREQVQNIE